MPRSWWVGLSICLWSSSVLPLPDLCSHCHAVLPLPTLCSHCHAASSSMREAAQLATGAPGVTVSRTGISNGVKYFQLCKMRKQVYWHRKSGNLGQTGEALNWKETRWGKLLENTQLIISPSPGLTPGTSFRSVVGKNASLWLAQETSSGSITSASLFVL